MKNKPKKKLPQQENRSPFAANRSKFFDKGDQSENKPPFFSGKDEKTTISSTPTSAHSIIQPFWLKKGGKIEWKGKADKPPKNARHKYQITGDKKWKYWYPWFGNKELDVWEEKPKKQKKGKKNSKGKATRTTEYEIMEPGGMEEDSSSHSYESSVSKKSKDLPLGHPSEIFEKINKIKQKEKEDLETYVDRLVDVLRRHYEFDAEEEQLKAFLFETYRETSYEEPEKKGKQKKQAKEREYYQYTIEDLDGYEALGSATIDKIKERIAHWNAGGGKGFKFHWKGVGGLPTMDVTGTELEGPGGGRGNVRLQFNNGKLSLVDHGGKSYL